MKGNITITRPSYGSEKEVIKIQVRDKNSRIAFLECEITLENYAKLLTGLSEVELDMNVKGLEFVGKKRMMKKHKVLLPPFLQSTYCDKAAVLEWVKDLYEDGVNFVHGRLDSNDSITKDCECQYWVNFSTYFYEDTEK